MSTNQKSIPKLRFPGFTDKWEHRRLSEIATMHARIGWQNLRTSEFLDDGDYLLITGTDFDDGRINFETCHYVEKERYEQDKYIQISNGSILITKDGTLGKVAYVQGLKKPATLNAGVFNVEIIDTDQTDGKYLYQFLKAPFLMEYVGQRATGGTIKHLNQSILVDFPVAISQKPEQEKIGEFLTYFDTLITLQHRKLDQIKEYKKGMLQKMFPKEGETVPEVRFPGFTGEWKRRKLSEILSLIKDGTHGTHADAKEGPLLLSAKNIKDGTIKWDDTDRRISQEEYEKIHSNFSLKNGDVLLTIVGSIGETAILKDSNGLTFQRSVAFLRPCDAITSEFLYTAIQTSTFQRELESRKSSSAQPGIYLGDLSEILFAFPVQREEQELIGEYVARIDALISLHQRKLETMKEYKKGLLQQMFV